MHFFGRETSDNSTPSKFGGSSIDVVATVGGVEKVIRVRKFWDEVVVSNVSILREENAGSDKTVT